MMLMLLSAQFFREPSMLSKYSELLDSRAFAESLLYIYFACRGGFWQNVLQMQTIEVIIKTSKGLAMTGYDIITDEKLQTEIISEFKENVKGG